MYALGTVTQRIFEDSVLSFFIFLVQVSVVDGHLGTVSAVVSSLSQGLSDCEEVLPLIVLIVKQKL